jgi:chromate transporter
MIYVQIFLAFFLPGIIGYGGGPASIPLIENEVVDTYGWMTTAEFSDTLAIGNALPGPIATKMAAYIGYEQAGVLGAAIALFATIGPSLILMLLLLNLLYRNRNSPRVKRLSSFVLPAIAILMAELTFDFFQTSVQLIDWIPTVIIAVLAYFSLEKWKVHPALVIVVGLVVGAILLQ